MARLKVTQIKSGIGGKQNQRDTLRSLGLKRLGDVLFLLPRCYEDRRRLHTIAELIPGERAVTLERRHAPDPTVVAVHPPDVTTIDLTIGRAGNVKRGKTED